MTGLRIAWKLGALCVTFGWGVVALSCAKLIGLVATQGKIRREDRIVRGWAARMTRVLGVHVHVEGEPPQAPFLLVSNHLSYVDVVVFMSQLDARLLSKAEVKSWPVLGWLARFGGTLFIDRANRRDIPRVLSEIESTLEQGRGVVFFPEGTSSPGLEVMPFKASLFEVAVKGQIDIATAAITYTAVPGERPAQWSTCWWGDMEFAPHLIGFLRVSRVDATLRFGEQHLRGEERKELATSAHREVVRLFEPVCSELGPDEPTQAQ